MLVLCLLLAGCQRPFDPGAEVMLESLQYQASGGHPAVTARLRVTSDRAASLYIGTSWSLPPDLLDRVGRFEAPVSDEEWDAIERVVAEAGLLGARMQADVTSPDPTVRTLTLGHSGTETRLSVSGTDPTTAAVEERLLVLMRRLVAEAPRSAVSGSVAFTVADDLVSPQVTLEHWGDEPLPLLLFDDDDPPFFLRLTFVFERELRTGAGEPIWLPVRTETVPRDQIAQWAADGSLKGGVHDMAPGSRYVLSPEPFAVPAGDEPLSVRTRIDLWLPGSGQSRRQATIELERQPVAPRT